MDFPKSVAGVGLVDGKFVDEDQVNGTPGSLIPAQWGNDVTEEILNVVREVGDVPAEATKNQLVSAIWKMFRSATAVATETLRGVLRVGTQAEVDAGDLDNVAVTPSKLKAHASIGVRQSWTDVTNSRAKDTIYTNATGRPILISIYVSMGHVNTDVSLLVNGGQIARAADAGWNGSFRTLTAVVPPGATYQTISVAGSHSIATWLELR